MNFASRILALHLIVLISPCIAMKSNSMGNSNSTKNEKSEKSSSHDNDYLFSSDDDSDASDEEADDFIVYIANIDAAKFYAHILETYKGNVNEWRRDQAKLRLVAQNEEFFKQTAGAQALCELLAMVSKKLKIKPELLKDVPKGVLVRLKTNEPQSLARVRKACKKSYYVRDVKTRDKEDLLRAKHQHDKYVIVDVMGIDSPADPGVLTALLTLRK